MKAKEKGPKECRRERPRTLGAAGEGGLLTCSEAWTGAVEQNIGIKSPGVRTRRANTPEILKKIPRLKM